MALLLDEPGVARATEAKAAPARTVAGIRIVDGESCRVYLNWSWMVDGTGRSLSIYRQISMPELNEKGKRESE